MTVVSFSFCQMVKIYKKPWPNELLVAYKTGGGTLMHLKETHAQTNTHTHKSTTNVNPLSDLRYRSRAMLRVWNSFSSSSSSWNCRGVQIRGKEEEDRMMARCVWISTIIITFMMLKNCIPLYAILFGRSNNSSSIIQSLHSYIKMNHIVYADHHHLSRCPLVSVRQRDEVIVTAMFNSNGSFIKFTTLFSLNRHPPLTRCLDIII